MDILVYADRKPSINEKIPSEHNCLSSIELQHVRMTQINKKVRILYNVYCTYS